MKKTLRTVIASLLLLVMLFSVSVTTIFAAEDVPSLGDGGTGSFDPITPPAESTGNSLDLGWISISYDDDSLDIIWHHQFSSMLETLKESPEKLREFAGMLKEGIEHLVLDSLKNGIASGDADSDTPVIGLEDVNNLMSIALDAYLGKNSAIYGSDSDEAALNFFKKIMSEDISAEDSCASDFSAYACRLLKLPVITDNISLEELRGKIYDGAALKSLIAGKAYQEIEDTVIRVAGIDSVTDEQQLDAAFEEKLGASKAEVEAKIEELESIIAEDYDNTIAELVESSELSLKDLLIYLQSVTVNGNAVCTFDGEKVSFQEDEFNKLLAEIPTTEEISNMKAEDMKLSWAIEIVTDFSTADFVINFSVGSNFSDVRKFAEALHQLIVVTNEEDGKSIVNINLFDSVHDVLLDLYESDELSAALKAELFDLINKPVSDIGDYLRNDFTYAKYEAIVKSIDFETLLLNFGIDDVTNEKMADFLCREGVFEKAKDVIISLCNSIPEELKEKTVLDFYEGNGVFSYANSTTFSVGALISKLEGVIPALKSFTSIIMGAVGDKTITSNYEIYVNVPKLYKINYQVTHPVTGVVETKMGLLPEGATLADFYGDRYEGYVIEEWCANSDGTGAVTAMPATDDFTVYANLQKLMTEVTITPNGEYEYSDGVVYDENKSYTLSVEPVYDYNTEAPEFSYQWYKGNTALAGETNKTLVITGNVLDSGEYWCKVTVVNDGPIVNVEIKEELSDKFTVSIVPKPINIGDYELEWNYAEPFVYDGEYHNVTIKLDSLNREGLPAIKLNPNGTYTNIEKVNAGQYTARANFVFVESDSQLASNYEFVNLDGTHSVNGYVEQEWRIDPKPFILDTSEFLWSVEENAKFTYKYGETKFVTLTLPEALKVVSYTDEAANQAGTYTTKAVIESSDPNYKWIGEEVLTRSWTIEKAKINLPDVAWNYDSENLPVYNGEDYTVSLADVPADIVWLYTDNVKSNAGTYVAKAEPDPNALVNNNYIFYGQVPDCEWEIKKQSIETLLELKWNYTDAFTYTGEEFAVELDIPEGLAEGITVSYVNNVASDAGSYSALATLVAIDNVNFEVTGNVEFALEWVVNKASVDLSGISFKNKTVYYNGLEQNIAITGTLPAGISVEYSAAVTEVGVYEVTATFVYNENNYEPIEPMTAKLTILPVYPVVNDFYKTDSDGNILVDIKAKHGVTANYELNVKDLSAQYVGYDFGVFFGAGTNGKVHTVYDIHFAESGTETPINDVFTVRLALPDNFNGDINNVRVVYIAENGELTDMNAMIDGDYIAFETIHFSIYAIVEVVERAEETEPVDLSWLPIAIAVAAVVLIIIIIVVKKRRNKNTPEAPTEPTEEPVPEEPSPEAEAEAAPEEEAAEETPVEESVDEETPEEEIPAEEALTEEAPLEEAKPSIVIHDAPPVQDGEAAAASGEIVHVRCRSSFMSRLIQSEPPIQDYYTILKNELLSYKGVKARMSWNFESFNSGRVQCAKLNVKGRSFLVYLGLDLEEYNVNKYHFTDASDKPKFEKVPMMLKVKSERSLRYALELIGEVMNKNGFEKLSNFKEVDYHMPYETTAALAERELVKLILPAGVSLAEGISLVKADVGAIIGEANAKALEEDSED